MKVAWLTPYPQSKLWDPALRLRRWNVHNELLKLGIDSVFFWETKDYDQLSHDLEDFGVVVFTEQSYEEYKLMLKLMAMGKVLYRDHCEYLFGFPYQQETFLLADRVICCSSVVEAGTTQWMPEVKTGVVEDMWERMWAMTPSAKKEELSAVFMGTSHACEMAKGLAPLLESEGYTLKIIGGPEDSETPWTAETWYRDYAGADIAICPQDPSLFPGKSSVKVAQALAYGYPVVASPLESYKQALEGGAGIIAGTKSDWCKALAYYRDEHNRRDTHYKAICKAYSFSPLNIAEKWLRFMEEDVSRKKLVFKTQGS